MKPNKQQTTWILILAGFLIFTIAVAGLSRKYSGEIDKITSLPATDSPIAGTPPSSTASMQPSENYTKVIHKIQLDPRGGGFLEHLFLADGKVVAAYKEAKGKIYDQSGTIPNGTIELFHEPSKIKGEENYRDGKRHGVYREFYPGGEVKKEAQYHRGRVITNKEYYANGALRLEQDLSNASWYLTDTSSLKDGTGKLYYPSGPIEREWDFTLIEGGGRITYFNQDGSVSRVERYDENGDLIPQSTPALL